MVRYKIEDLKNARNEIWVESSKDEFFKVLDKLGVKSYNNKLYADPIHFYLRNNESPENSFGWNYTNGLAQIGKTIILFSQIDFQENLVECIEIW